jgi:hypothetical protein
MLAGVAMIESAVVNHKAKVLPLVPSPSLGDIAPAKVIFTGAIPFGNGEAEILDQSAVAVLKLLAGAARTQAVARRAFPARGQGRMRQLLALFRSQVA